MIPFEPKAYSLWGDKDSQPVSAFYTWGCLRACARVCEFVFSNSYLFTLLTGPYKVGQVTLSLLQNISRVCPLVSIILCAICVNLSLFVCIIQLSGSVSVCVCCGLPCKHLFFLLNGNMVPEDTKHILKREASQKCYGGQNDPTNLRGWVGVYTYVRVWVVWGLFIPSSSIYLSYNIKRLKALFLSVSILLFSLSYSLSPKITKVINHSSIFFMSGSIYPHDQKKKKGRERD